MGRKQCLLINKKEWERLKSQTCPPEAPDNHKQEYVQSLINKSQEWLKTWPDTVQGTVAKVAKQKERHCLREIAFVKAHTAKQKNNNQNTADAIQKARQIIFERTCYGKQLISAILESKALEERDLQIRFQKELKEKAIQLAKEVEAKQSYFFGSETTDKVQQKKQTNKEIAEINKKMYEHNLQTNTKEKEKEKQLELEDARLMKQLLDFEATEKDHCKVIAKQAVEEYEADQKKIRKRKLKDEEQEEKLAKAWYKYQDRIRCKQKRIFDQMHKDKHDTALFKSTYDNLQVLLEKEKKTYDDFIEKGIKKLDTRLFDGYKSDIEKQKERYEKLIAQCRENQSAAEIEQIMRCNNNNKCFCERQSLFTKSRDANSSKKAIEMSEEKECLIFLKPANKLLEALKKHEKEPTPWSGLKSTHELFARQACDALAECSYKHVATKVVDNYRKVNGLDSSALRVSNY